MIVIARIAMKCPNSKSQFDPKWFELELLLYLINLQWDYCYSNICDEMSKFEVSILFKMVWVRASVISDKSSMRDTVIATFAMKCPNSKSQFYLKWFELELLLISDKSSWDFLWSIAMKCPNSKSQFDPKWFELELLISYKSSMRWLL